MPEKRDNPNRIERDAFEREVGTDLDEATPDKPKGIPLHTKILIGLATLVTSGSLWFVPATLYFCFTTWRATIREDQQLSVALPDYPAYQAQTTRLVPWLI